MLGGHNFDGNLEKNRLGFIIFMAGWSSYGYLLGVNRSNWVIRYMGLCVYLSEELELEIWGLGREDCCIGFISVFCNWISDVRSLGHYG